MDNMNEIKIPLLTLQKSNSTGNDSGRNHTRCISKPRDNVLLSNGNACYRHITERTVIPTTTVWVKVMQCVARKRLKKCILTVDDIVEGKTFKNTQFVFKAGDSVTIIHSRVCEEYGVGTAATIKPQRMLGTEATKHNAGCKQRNNNNNKRQYGRKEKDASNVWLIVTTSDGKSRLWQRNMELLGMFIEVKSVEHIEAEAGAVGMATDMARVCHRDGGDRHMCCKVQVTPDSALWIDEELLHTEPDKSGEVKRPEGQTKEGNIEKAIVAPPPQTQEENDDDDEEELKTSTIIGTTETETGTGIEECEETEWMALCYNEQLDMLYEEGCIT